MIDHDTAINTELITHVKRVLGRQDLDAKAHSNRR
jgi:hypothetical protein